MQNRISNHLLLLILICQPLSLFGWSKYSADIDINCEQDGLELNCEYRSPRGSQLKDIKVYADDQLLTIQQQPFKPGKDSPVALLFLVDTSDPGRQPVIEKNKSHIQQLLKQVKPDYQVGLAAFDKTLRIEAPISESRFLLSKQVKQLQATGKTTELYRNVIEALQYLERQAVSRKVLVLMSDGQAEDKAYFHSDVIRVARDANIIINSIGYPRTVSLSVALQTLRRLSEETGGSYTETDINYNLPSGFTSSAFANVESGGSIFISLQGVANAARLNRLAFQYSTAQSKRSFFIPLQSGRQTAAAPAPPAAPAAVAQAKPAASAESTTAPVTIVTREVETQPVNLWLWYGIPAAFIIIIIFILITLFLLWQRPASSKPSSATTYEFKPYAYLIDKNDENKRYPITRTIWRIGRGKDNELPLDDSSISRRHAEIHRNINGGFDILDMNSMNGVYINGEKVGKAMLEEGDVIEVGDILLKFSQYAPEYGEEESTVMQKTKTPELSVT